MGCVPKTICRAIEKMTRPSEASRVTGMTNPLCFSASEYVENRKVVRMIEALFRAQASGADSASLHIRGKLVEARAPADAAGCFLASAVNRREKAPRGAGDEAPFALV